MGPEEERDCLAWEIAYKALGEHYEDLLKLVDKQSEQIDALMKALIMTQRELEEELKKRKDETDRIYE